LTALLAEVAKDALVAAPSNMLAVPAYDEEIALVANDEDKGVPMHGKVAKRR